MHLAPEHRVAFVNKQPTQCSNNIKTSNSIHTVDQNDFALSHHIDKESDLLTQQSTIKIGNIISIFKAKRIDGRFEQTVVIKVN